MSKPTVVSLAAVTMFAMAVTGAEMTKHANCTQVSAGARGGYFAQKVFKCEIDVNRLMLTDPSGNKNSAPAGTYRVDPDNNPLNVGAGGYILR